MEERRCRTEYFARRMRTQNKGQKKQLKEQVHKNTTIKRQKTKRHLMFRRTSSPQRHKQILPSGVSLFISQTFLFFVLINAILT